MHERYKYKKTYSEEFKKLLETYGSKVDSSVNAGGLSYEDAIEHATTFNDLMRCWIIARSPEEEEDAILRMVKIRRTPKQSERLWGILPNGAQIDDYSKHKKNGEDIFKSMVAQKRYMYG